MDNRPTTLVIANPPADLSGDKLLAHFKARHGSLWGAYVMCFSVSMLCVLRTLSHAATYPVQPFGEVTSFSVQGGHATVQFAARRSAEQAMERGKRMGDAELAMAWLGAQPSEAGAADVGAGDGAQHVQV